MKIDELQDKQGKVNIDLKIIWDNAEPKEMFGKKIKTVLVADAESEQGDNSPTAYLDLIGDNITKFKHMDKIRVIDAYSKLRNNGQFWIVNASKITKI
ncbi:MAG: hypothetical protein KKE05_05780 [Nanoarchaeota archaeon]|nr:hypothetical protein [Nanoarchaeota archaeon]